MKRIKFTRTEQFESEGRNQGPIYVEGSVHDFDDAFADRWLRRSAAVEVDKRTPLSATGPVQADEAASLDGLNFAGLTAIATHEGATIEGLRSKAEVTAAILAHREKAQAGEGGVGDDLESLDAAGLSARVEDLAITLPEGTDRGGAIAAIRDHLKHAAPAGGNQ
jgi:hypothetical protein